MANVALSQSVHHTTLFPDIQFPFYSDRSLVSHQPFSDYCSSSFAVAVQLTLFLERQCADRQLSTLCFEAKPVIPVQYIAATDSLLRCQPLKVRSLPILPRRWRSHQY